jgi:hypothetical protein
LPKRHLAALVQRAVPVLRYFEKVIHPRSPTPFEATKRLVGTVVVILNITLVFTPASGPRAAMPALITAWPLGRLRRNSSLSARMRSDL